MNLDKCWKVGKLECTAWVEHVSGIVGDDPMVANLCLGLVKDRIIRAKTALAAYVKGTLTWKVPVKCTALKLEFLALLDEHVTASAETWRHVDSINGKIEEAANETSKEKGGWRTERNKIESHLVQRKVPSGVAKVCADAVWCEASPPEALDISLPYSPPPCAVTDESDLSAFASPFLVKYDPKKTEAQQTKIEVTWSNEYRENLPAATSKMTESKTVMRSGSSAYGNTSFSPAKAVDLNLGKVGDPWFRPLVVKPALWTSHTETLNATVECFPYTKLPGWIVSYIGSFVIIVLDQECVTRVGDIASWVQSCESSELYRFASWFVHPGDAVWIPPGHAPLLVGIPNTVKCDVKSGVDLKACKQNQMHFMAAAFYPVLDAHWVSVGRVVGHEQGVCAGFLVQGGRYYGFRGGALQSLGGRAGRCGGRGTERQRWCKRGRWRSRRLRALDVR